VQVGDWAYLSTEDTQSLIAQRSLSSTRKYPVVIASAKVTRLTTKHAWQFAAASAEINRARGRIGFDYSEYRRMTQAAA